MQWTAVPAPVEYEARRVTATPPVFDQVPGAGPEALEEFLDRIRPRLKQVLNRSSIPYADAEDVLQEALLVALQKWDTISNLEAWLIGTLRFTCSNFWKKKRKQETAMDLELLEDLCVVEAPAQEQLEVLLDLRRLTCGLGKRHQAMLWLRFYMGMSPAEVARQLGYHPASVRKLTLRSLRRLRRDRHDQRSRRMAGATGGAREGAEKGDVQMRVTT